MRERRLKNGSGEEEGVEENGEKEEREKGEGGDSVTVFVGNHFQSFSSIWIIICYVLLLKNKKTLKPKIVQPQT
jgi:hypothetical protein